MYAVLTLLFVDLQDGLRVCRRFRSQLYFHFDYYWSPSLQHRFQFCWFGHFRIDSKFVYAIEFRSFRFVEETHLRVSWSQIHHRIRCRYRLRHHLYCLQLQHCRLVLFVCRPVCNFFCFVVLTIVFRCFFISQCLIIGVLCFQQHRRLSCCTACYYRVTKRFCCSNYIIRKTKPQKINLYRSNKTNIKTHHTVYCIVSYCISRRERRQFR